MKETIQSLIPLSEETYQIFQAAAKKKIVAKNTVLFSPPRPAKKMLFLASGMLRGYKIIDGKDYTHHFFTAGWFATDYKSFLDNQPSAQFIESLSEVHFYEFDREVLQQLYANHHPLEKLGRIIAETAFLLTVEKFSNMQTLDLKERYKNLVNKSPQLFQEVPQKYIASYLGASEQSVSRIKKELFYEQM